MIHQLEIKWDKNCPEGLCALATNFFNNVNVVQTNEGFWLQTTDNKSFIDFLRRE